MSRGADCLDITATDWNVDMPVPFKAESSIRFVSVDIEAWEQSTNVITEVGLAILDTQDTINVPPGRDGYGWFPLIKSHHFIIEEHKYKINYKYVHGCPEQFNFGYGLLTSNEELSLRVIAISNLLAKMKLVG